MRRAMPGLALIVVALVLRDVDNHYGTSIKILGEPLPFWLPWTDTRNVLVNISAVASCIVLILGTVLLIRSLGPPKKR